MTPGRELRDVPASVGARLRNLARHQQAIDHLREFRIALISAVVTDKIDVREAASR